MKVIYNNIIPFKRFLATCLWPFIYVREEYKHAFTARVERHENTHGEQQKELLVVGCSLAAILYLCGCGWWSLLAIPLFFWWYGIEWLVRLCIYRNPMTAYKNICFEREAYDNESDIVYLDTRKHFAFIHYIRN